MGNDIIPFPYMISRKIEGREATHHRLRRDIIRDMGKYASLIHTIPTKGYGHTFDWSPNTLSKNDNWKSYLKVELKADERLAVLKKYKMLTPGIGEKISMEITKIGQRTQQPCLHHGELRLKNVLVNESGKIIAIIDWENAVSSVGPGWDMSIALHDLSIDARWEYLEGYGIADKKLLEISPAIKVFNVLNYAPVVEKLVDKKQRQKSDQYKLRLKGILDLFSI